MSQTIFDYEGHSGNANEPSADAVGIHTSVSDSLLEIQSVGLIDALDAHLLGHLFHGFLASKLATGKAFQRSHTSDCERFTAPQKLSLLEDDKFYVAGLRR